MCFFLNFETNIQKCFKSNYNLPYSNLFVKTLGFDVIIFIKELLSLSTEWYLIFLKIIFTTLAKDIV